MAYTVTIKYTPVVQTEGRSVDNICPAILPDSSYVDTDVYVNGHEEDYGKSIYATNVQGNSFIPAPSPFDFTHIPMASPLAQFDLSTVLDDGKKLEEGVEFTVDGYQQAFYYKTLGEQLVDQGFTVTVEKKN